MKKALLVIDIDHNDGWTPRYDSFGEERKQVEAAIKEKLVRERAAGTLIVFIVLGTYVYASGQEAQYELGNVYIPDPLKCPHTKNSCLVCDMGERNRLAEFLEHRHESEPVFIKVVNDAFHNQNLAKYLSEKEITNLELIGCNTDACVKSTAAGAIKAGFKVTLYAKASYPLTIKSEADKSWWIESVKREVNISQDQEAPISVIV